MTKVEGISTSDPGEWLLLTVSVAPPAANATAPLPKVTTVSTSDKPYKLAYATCTEQIVNGEFRYVPETSVDSAISVEQPTNSFMNDLRRSGAIKKPPPKRYQWWGTARAVNGRFKNSFACVDTNKSKDKPLAMLSDNDDKSAILLEMPRTEAIKMVWVFRVPTDAKGLQLNVGSMASVAVPDGTTPNITNP
jgi:hypothetical protein